MRYIIYAFLLIYTVFICYHIYDVDGLRLLENLSAADIATIIYPLVAFLVVYILNRLKKKFRPKTSEMTVIIIFITSILYLGIAIALFEDANKSPMAILTGGFFATMGWIFTSNEAKNNAKKSHTLTVLLQMRNSADFNKNREIVLDYLNKYPTVSDKEISAEQAVIASRGKDINLERSVTYALNYYEFICAGYITRDLDESLLIKTHGGILLKYFEWFKPYILEERNKDTPPNHRLYKNLEDTCIEFKRKREKEDQKSAWRAFLNI